MFKCDKGVLGKPRFKDGDKVGFYLKPHKMNEEVFFVGTVEIIDRYGTFEQDEEPSYDIMVENWLDSGERMFVKHVRESSCYVLED